MMAMAFVTVQKVQSEMLFAPVWKEDGTTPTAQGALCLLCRDSELLP